MPTYATVILPSLALPSLAYWRFDSSLHRTRNMEVVPLPEQIADAFMMRSIYNTIFSHLNPASLMRMKRVSRSLRHAVEDFSHHAYSVNRLLSRFVSDPIAFRSLQARTATLISGSVALQLFDRTFYPESDLDLFVYGEHAQEVGGFLQRDGYVLTPNSQQAGDFIDAVSHAMFDVTSVLQGTQIQPVDQEHLPHHQQNAIAEVFTFTRTFSFAGRSELTTKVQIVVPREHPLACILAFHSTCVMNLITYNAAYSLYPHATFEKRESLAIFPEERQGSALRKYAARGWKIINGTSPFVPPSYTEGASLSESDHFFFEQTRWVRGKHSWIIRLDTDGVQSPASPSATSAALAWDPVEECSWAMRSGDSPRMLYLMAKSPALKYRYTVADAEYLQTLVESLMHREERELSKLPTGVTSGGGEHWTWWDSEIPRFREKYWRSILDRQI